MSKLTFDVADKQELFLLDASGKEINWFCYLEEVEETGKGLTVTNDCYTYHIPKSYYDTYRIGDCTCENVKSKSTKQRGEKQ